MKRNILKLSVMCFGFFFIVNQNAIAMVRGQTIVDNARYFKGLLYSDGDPPVVTDPFGNKIMDHAWENWGHLTNFNLCYSSSCLPNQAI